MHKLTTKTVASISSATAIFLAKSSVTRAIIEDGSGGGGGTGDVSTHAITNPVLGEPLQSTGGLAYFQKLIPGLVGLLFIIGAIVFFFMLLVGGIRWMTSAGDKAALEGARGMIVNAIIGIIILFSAFAIVSLIETFFNVAILSIDIGPLFIR